MTQHDGQQHGQLVPRVPVRLAAKYLGRSARWVQQEILAGRIPAIDTSRPGAKRPHWSIAVDVLRSLVAKFEVQAELRRREYEAQNAKDASVEPRAVDTAPPRARKSARG